MNGSSCPATLATILPVQDYSRDFLLLATRNGVIKKTKLAEFEEVRRNGKIAMRLDPDDQLIAVRPATDESHVLLVSSEGQSVRFKIDDLRDASRTSGGVRGMTLAKGGYIVGVETIDDGAQLLIISERGFGKRTDINRPDGSYEYPLQKRGGQGVKTLNITEKTGNVAACRMVRPGQELMLVSRDGIVIRTSVNSISLLGRNTQGVTIMRVAEGDQVASIAAISLDGPVRENRVVSDYGNGVSPNGVTPHEVGPVDELDEDEEQAPADDDGAQRDDEE